MLLPVLQALTPHPCASCGAIGKILCPRCKAYIASGFAHRCVVCGVWRGTCDHAMDWVSYVCNRTGFIQTIVDDAKFRYRRDSYAILAEFVSPYVRPDAVLVPIPTRQAHIRQRGYDHAAVLARCVARLSGMRVHKILRRNSEVVMHQLQKNERLHAAQGLFSCTLPLCPDKHYVLIDDIFTTGATIRAARHALLEAGARRVQAVVIVRQPLDSGATLW